MHWEIRMKESVPIEVPSSWNLELGWSEPAGTT